MGHSSARITMDVYQHPDEVRKRAAVEAAGAVLSKLVTPDGV